MASHHRARQSDAPPVDGMSVEVWAWLRESMTVRPVAVAIARARLDAGARPSSVELADALLHAAI